VGALGSRRSPHSSAPEPGPTRHASGERHGRHARHQSPTHAIDGTNGLHAPRRPPVAGPSPQEAETPPLEPRYASPLKATWPARATHSAPQQLPQQPAEESVTSARQDHTSDTPDGCHNKGKWQRADGEAADRLGQLPAIIQDNKLDSPAESFKALVIAGNNVAGARSRRPKGVPGHQVQRPSDAAPRQHANAHARFISLRDRSINLRRTEQLTDINTTAQAAIRRFRCCASDDLPQRPLAPNGQHPYHHGGELDQSSRLATKQRIRGRRSRRRSTIAGGSTAGRQECRT